MYNAYNYARKNGGTYLCDMDDDYDDIYRAEEIEDARADKIDETVSFRRLFAKHYYDEDNASEFDM